MCDTREYNLRVGEFFLLDIIKWECADDRMFGGVEDAFFFLAVNDKLKKSEVGHAAGAYGLNIPYFSFDSPARNRDGRVGRTCLDKSNRPLDLDLSR